MAILNSVVQQWESLGDWYMEATESASFRLLSLFALVLIVAVFFEFLYKLYVYDNEVRK